jgi:hypothetical protein
VIALEPDRVGLDVVDEVRLEADDRLDPVLVAGLVELDGAVHHAVVGQAEGGLAEGGGALGQRVDLAGAVEQRIFAVDVEMGSRRWRHGGPTEHRFRCRQTLA